MREKKMRKHRILAFLMAFLMIFTMIPTTAFAASDDTESSNYAVTFYGHSAQLTSYKLYTYENETKGETDLLNGVEGVSGSYNYYMNISYTTELPAGDYWLEGYDSNGDYNGGIVITVDEAEEFYVLRAYSIYASNSGWILGTDYELSAEVTNTDKSINRQAEMGSAIPYGNTAYASCICLHGDTVKITYTPLGDKADLCIETFKSKTMTANDSSWSQKIPESTYLTFIVPDGSKVSTGKFHTYYIYDYIEPTAEGSYGELTPDDTSDDDDTREYATFKIPKESVNLSSGPYFFYRVQNEKGVTYWDFYDPTKLTETTIEITEEQLFIDSEEFNSESIYHFDHNTYDSANIYMNVNAQGYMNLEKGDEFELNVFRNWMAIENFYNRRVALPDMEYEVINLEGDTVISITPDKNNSCVANIEAVGEGTAIVLVTYDAMFSNCAYVSGTPYQPNKFSAIWPENTGVFVVSVGADGTSIETNMEMDRLGSTGNLDAEHDILFYVDDDGTDDGTSYTFTPEADCTVTVNRSTVTETEMNFGTEFTSDRVVTADDGSVTVSGLTTGRHIIKVEKDDVAAYQVISVRKVSYELQDENGNKLTEEDEIKAGDTVYIQFSGLVNPNEKMSGVYNHSAVIRYIGEDETAYTSLPGGAYGVYDFSGNPERQKIAIEIPKYWDGDSYSLHGAIKMNVSGDAAGKHRNVTYAKGVNANYGAESSGTILSSLPDINIALAETDFLTGTLSFADNDENAVNISDIAQISMSDTDGNVINVGEDGTFVCVPGDYHYEIYAAGYMYKTGTVTVAEDDTTPSFTIELEKASEGAWDGVTMNVPETDEEGIYLISTGAELAWFVNESITSAVSGKLTADIDLAGYEWKYNTSTNTTNAIVLDGNGKEITNLYSTTAGLFGYLGTGSSVRNLTIRGEINSTKQTIGAITSYLYGANSVIENCVSYVNITSTQGYLGGIAGNCLGTIKNCANYGNIQSTGTSSAVAGIVASLSKGAKIENCLNAGTIIGASMTSGIVGYVGNYEVTVTGCYNTGAIAGSGNYTGGIVGSMIGGNGYAWQGGAATLKGCYNTGAVTGVQYVGGLVGNIGTANVSDCYNRGTVTGTSNVGGAVGRISDTKVTAERCYYLTDTAESDAGAVALTESELKVAELSTDYFGGTCSGYPALLWQSDVTFHTASEDGIITAPNCTEKGYTTYTCPACTESYRDDYTDALGHDWCECTEDNQECEDCEYTAPTCTETGSIVHTCRRDNCTETKTDTVNELGHDWCECAEENTECTDCEYTAPTCTEKGSIVHTCRRDDCTETKTDVISANGHREDESQTVTAALYKDCVCIICGVPYRVWNDSRIQYMSLDDTIVSDITLTDNGSYPWTYNATRERYESSCSSVNNGTSETTISVTLTGKGLVSFDYGVSSENNFDKLTIAANIGGTTVTIANAISGTQSGSFEQELEAGTYNLTFTYTKDVSGNNGDDCGWINNVSIQSTEIHVHEYSDAWKSNDTQHWKECECDDKAEIADHSFEWVIDKEETVDETGLKHEECTVCHAKRNENTEIPVELPPIVPDEPVSVFFSVSHDADYAACEETGEVMALKETEVPYFDLAAYGLEEYKDANLEGKITMLHLYLYATEVYYCGLNEDEAGKGYLYDEEILGTEVLNIGGSAGSMFLDNFWNLGYNLNYYLNYEYPLAYEGWGATADQIVLEDGDVVTLGAFTSWSFFGDPTSVFNYIKAGEEIVRATAKQGDKVNMTLYHAGSDTDNSGTTVHTALTSRPEVYYKAVSDLDNGIVSTWTSLGQADENGNITADTRNMDPGEYLIAIAGQYGSTYTDEICSAPGGIILTVTENPELPPIVEENTVIRISGEDRNETSYKVADALKDELGIEKFDTVIVATGKNFADALSGSYLAVLKDAPILLTNSKTENVSDLCDYINDNLTKDGMVYILGGDVAVSAETQAALEADHTVVRLCGDSRYETSIEILNEAGLEDDTDLIVATGKDFADSLSASALKKPILLVKPNAALTDAQKELAAKAGQIYIVGGTDAVTEATEDELKAIGNVKRIAGSGRQETSKLVAEEFFGEVETVVLAKAMDFPDGLCGGPLAAAMNAPLLLTRDGKSTIAEGYVQGLGIESGIVLGGDKALADQTVVDVFALESAEDIIVK